MTYDPAAAPANAMVADALARAGMTDPADRVAHHAALQAHVPRMVARLVANYDVFRAGKDDA